MVIAMVMVIPPSLLYTFTTHLLVHLIKRKTTCFDHGMSSDIIVKIKRGIVVIVTTHCYFYTFCFVKRALFLELKKKITI